MFTRKRIALIAASALTLIAALTTLAVAMILSAIPAEAQTKNQTTALLVSQH